MNPVNKLPVQDSQRSRAKATTVRSSQFHSSSLHLALYWLDHVDRLVTQEQHNSRGEHVRFTHAQKKRERQKKN